MKKSVIVLLSCLVFAACGDRASDSDNSDQARYIPSLDVSLKIDGNDVKVTFETDMHMSTEHYGMARETGEGHVHMYLDDDVKITAEEKIYMFPDLAPGPHKLKVGLHNNDHTPYDISKTIEFDIP